LIAVKHNLNYPKILIGVLFPKFISINNAVYLCQNCANVHRNFGECSIVKSPTLDRWDALQIKIMSLGGNQRLKHFLIDYFLPQNCDPKYKYFIKAVAYYREQLRYEALAMEGSESFVKMPIRPDGIEGLDVIIKQNIQPIQPVQTFQPKSEPTPKTNKSVNLLDNDWNDWEYFLNSKKTSNNNPNNPNSNNNTNSTNFNNNASYLSNTNNSNIHNTIGNRNNNSVNSVSDNFTLQNKRTDVQQHVAKPKGFFEEIDGFFKKIDKEFTEVFKDAKINETFEDLSRMSTNYFGNFVENTKKVFCIVNE